MRITFIFFALFLSVMTAWGATSTLPKVTGVSASQGSLYGKVNITWKANVLATGYDLYKSTSSSTSGTLIASNLTGLSFDDTRVYQSDSYYYRVVAKNAKGSAPPSANNKGWGKVPGSVSTLTATQGTAVNSVQLNWIDVPDATRYKVYRSTIPNSLMTLVGTATTNSYIDSITGTETTYYYRVTALVINVEGLLSDKTTNEASWLKSPLPEQVTGVSATQGTLYGKVNVTWSASMLPGAYDIYRSTSDGLKGDLVAADILVTHFEDTRVSGSASYYYTVVATNTFGNAPDSAQAVGSGKVPATLTGLTATQGAVTGLVMLSWSSDADSTGYEIWRRSSLIEAPVFIQTTTYTTFFDTSVSGVGNYYYIVKNRIGNVTGSFSSEVKGYANAAPTTATVLIQTTANAVSPETSPSITDANSEAGQDESFALAITEQTMVGSVSVNAGKFTYSPPADGIFSGPQPFKFNVTDKPKKIS